MRHGQDHAPPSSLSPCADIREHFPIHGDGIHSLIHFIHLKQGLVLFPTFAILLTFCIACGVRILSAVMITISFRIVFLKF